MKSTISILGKSVVLIEPGKHLGGLTSGGLGATDIGNKKAIGGLSGQEYVAHYAKRADPVEAVAPEPARVVAAEPVGAVAATR